MSRQIFEVITPGGKVVAQEALEDAIRAVYMMPNLQVSVRDVTAKPGQLVVNGVPADVVAEHDGFTTFREPHPFRNDSEARTP